MTTNPATTNPRTPPRAAGASSASAPGPEPDRLASIRRPVEADLAAVDARILENLESRVPLIRETGGYLISRG